MKVFNRGVALSFALLLLLVIAACGASNDTEKAKDDEEEVYELRLGTVVSAPHPWIEMSHFFAEEVEERTDGKVTVSVHESSTLGNDSVLYDELQLGTIDFSIGGGTALAASIPEYQIFSFGYLFDDVEEFENAVVKPDGEILERFKEITEEKNAGQSLLSLSSGGERNVYHIDKLIKTPSDIKGEKMRLPGSDIMVNVWSAMGAVPTTLPFNELYSGLQTGLADSFEVTTSGYNGSKMDEVAPYASLTQHEFTVTYMNYSDLTAEKLPDEYNEIIEEVAAEAAVIGTENSKKVDVELIEELKEKGVEYEENVDKAAFKEIAEPLHDEMAEDLGVTDLLEMIQDLKD